MTLAIVLGLFVLCGGAKVVDRFSLGHFTIQVIPLTVLLAMGLVGGGPGHADRAETSATWRFAPSRAG